MGYHDNISFISDIPDELTDYQIPKLTLQPVIENCVLRHSEKDTKAGTIVLTGWMEQEDNTSDADDGVESLRKSFPQSFPETAQVLPPAAQTLLYTTHIRDFRSCTAGLMDLPIPAGRGRVQRCRSASGIRPADTGSGVT